MGWVTARGAGRFAQAMPRPAAVVTCEHEGRRNALSVAWHAPISFDPPLFGISIGLGRHSLGMILGSGQFAVNFLPLERAELIAALGGCSGSRVDKFQRFGLEVRQAVAVRAPLLECAYAAYECQVVDHRRWGDHEWIVGQVLVTHLRAEAFPEEVLEVGRCQPALYLGADLYLGAAPEARHLDRRRYGKGRAGG